jgi:hypothetical protein
MLVCSWRTDKCLLFCESVLCCCSVFNVGGWAVVVGFFMLFVVVYYGVEDRVVNVCVYFIKV